MVAHLLDKRTDILRECVSVYGLTFQSTHNRSLQRRDFPGNQLISLVLTTKNNQTQHYIYLTHTREIEKSALANRTIYTPVWYAFYDPKPGNGVGPSQPRLGLNSLVRLNYTQVRFTTKTTA